MKLLIMQFSPAILFSPNIFPSIVFSNTLCLYCSLNVRDQILVCYCQSQIFELCHILKGSTGYLYGVILPCILLTWHQHHTVHKFWMFPS
jgi:hypothetical protein